MAIKKVSVVNWVYRTRNISHRERTAPPRHLKLSCLTQPLPACSVGNYTGRQVVQYIYYRAGRGWVRQLYLR